MIILKTGFLLKNFESKKIIAIYIRFLWIYIVIGKKSSLSFIKNLDCNMIFSFGYVLKYLMNKKDKK